MRAEDWEWSDTEEEKISGRIKNINGDHSVSRQPLPRVKPPAAPVEGITYCVGAMWDRSGSEEDIAGSRPLRTPFGKVPPTQVLTGIVQGVEERESHFV